MSSSLTITWLGHSCFKVESDGYAVVFDPYEDGSVPGLGPLRVQANEVFCSHGHGDHNAVHVVTLAARKKSPFCVTKVETYHDDAKGAKRGSNTIHILDNDSLRVAHFGDLGCALQTGQKEQLRGLDVVMIPVGGHYTIDAKQAKEIVDELKPRVVIPMHYRSEEHGFGFDVLGTIEKFTDLCENVIRYPGNMLNLTPETRQQVAVLTYVR